MQPIIIERKKFNDNRGYFFESYRKDLFKENYGIDLEFVQDNFSFSKRNVLRGLHYQWDKPMHKLVKVTHGEILDIIVDIRSNSPTYGKVFYYELSEQNGLQLFVPAGFAHGFFVRSETAHVQYKCSEFYNKSGESGINPLDPDLNIDLGTDKDLLVISEKDVNSKFFKEYKLEPKF